MKKLLIVSLIIMILTGCQSKGCVVDDTMWYDKYRVVGHAFGDIDGYDYTNSLEAFETNYAKGTRVFEIDLQMTTDGKFALVHEWDQYHTKLTDINEWGAVDSQTFKETKLYGKYTPLLLDDVLQLMKEYCDFYLVIDSKTFNVEGAYEFYSELVKQVSEVDEQLLHRIIPQAYSMEIYDAIASLESFDDIIFTLYAIYVETDGDKVYRFVEDRGITVVVMHMDNEWAARVIRDVKGYALSAGRYEKIRIYIHTVNDMDVAKSIVFDERFRGIYTDVIGETEYTEIINKGQN